MNTLNDWLTHLETAHSGGLIDMGLSRISEVKHAMKLIPPCPIITVAGTNGKGSVCAFLTWIYRQAGFKVGTLTSPHLLKYNERIRINAEPVSDNDIIASFQRIEAARGHTSLTYFEFNTLAAVDIFIHQNVDIMILEVGMGGRLDAVNVFDTDCAVITGIDLDHQSFLGDTVEAIAYEKAGILRSGKPAVCGQNPPPISLQQHARTIGADLLLSGHDFSFSRPNQQQWSFDFHPTRETGFSESSKRKRNALPIPALRGAYQLNNAACALAAVECLNHRLPIDIGAIKQGLLLAENSGRFQVLPGRPLTVLDVAHNPQAARTLRQSLLVLPFAAQRIAVFSVLADKDSDNIIETVKDQFDRWYIAPLHLPRGMAAADIAHKLYVHGIQAVEMFNNIQTAYQVALEQAEENDRIIVFGSFHTVAEVMAIL